MEWIRKYLERIADDQVSIKKYNAKRQLSLFLAASYTYYLVKFLEVEFLIVKLSENATVLQMQKHFRIIEEKTGYRVVFAVETLSSYKRKKLIKSLIPFISMDGQMFLPFLGMYLEEKRRKKEEKRLVKRFTPAMQLIYLMILYKYKTIVTQEEICRETKVSVMTVSRALEAFVDMELLTYKIEGKTGRKKIYQCEDKKKYFEIGRAYLMNPVKRSFYVQRIPDEIKKYKSGLLALSEKTMLGEPEHLIYAVSPEQEKELLVYRVSEEMGAEEAYPEVQIMKYDIGVLEKEGYVDEITTILSLMETDDRIEIAIGELMEEYNWYRG